jgi:YfiH family protein
MRQVHGGAVARVGRGEAGRGASDHADAVPGVDGLVTTADDLGLVVLAADCVPLLLAAPGAGVAAVHAGRNGVARNVCGAAVALLVAATGTAPGGLAAVVGPAIGGCCYEVPARLADDIAAVAPAARSETTWGRASLDLSAGVVAQLQASGVRAVARAGGCTRCDPATWFSHRATTAGRAAAGRQAGIVRRVAGAGHAAPPRAGALFSLH